MSDANAAAVMPKDDKKTVNAWASYDAANSVYNLIITTAIFPAFYDSQTIKAFYKGDPAKIDEAKDVVLQFFGMDIKNTVLFTYAITFSYLVIVLLSPILSGIADYSGKKKIFMQFFTYLGAVSCIGLFWFEGPNVELGIICSVLASIGYAGSLVFYNAFLPEIASEPNMDKVSARGFSMGYFGSVILLVISLALILSQGDNASQALFMTKISFIMVGIWWFLVAQIAFKILKDRPTNHKVNASVLTKGFKELRKVFKSLREHKTAFRYLTSYFIYSMGVQTVILLASLFGKVELKMETSQMIILILMIQVFAIGGAMGFAKLSDWKGNKFSIVVALIVWMTICVLAFFLTGHTEFYILGGFVGLVMGGIQSMSRSTYSKLIPQDTEDTASYFSFYDVTEKLAIVIGTFTYGYILEISSMRYSILSMAVFFFIGLIILLATKMPFKKAEGS